jgi:hypothetical protein
MAPSFVQLAAGMHAVFFAGLWACQALHLGTISFIHMTMGVFLIVLLLARTRLAWFLCLVYDGVLVGSLAFRLLGTEVGWEQKAVLGNVLVLGMGIGAGLTLLRPKILGFVFFNKR